MNWKLILLSVVIVGLLGYMYLNRSSSLESFKVPTPEQNTFTMYYADWCGHCKKAKPDFEQFMAKSPVDINGTPCVIRMISPEKQPEEAKRKLNGFPTFMLDTTDGQTVEYKGERTMDGYLKFLNDTLGTKADA